MRRTRKELKAHRKLVFWYVIIRAGPLVSSCQAVSNHLISQIGTFFWELSRLLSIHGVDLLERHAVPRTLKYLELVANAIIEGLGLLAFYVYVVISRHIFGNVVFC